MQFVYDDGGRKAAEYRGDTGDCATRAIAIVTGTPYQNVYQLVNEYGRAERKGKNRRSKSSARTGVWSLTMRRIMADLGWSWQPTMAIGQGCTVHLRAEELPGGKLIVRTSKHYVAVINGVVHDTYDPSRDGTRCVYGYWYH